MTHPDEIPATVPDDVQALAWATASKWFDRPRIEPSELRDIIAHAIMADRASRPDTPAVEGEAVAWQFEMRTTFTPNEDGERIWNWKTFIFKRCPPKDDDSIRNITPLYTHPTPTQDVARALPHGDTAPTFADALAIVAARHQEWGGAYHSAADMLLDDLNSFAEKAAPVAPSVERQAADADLVRRLVESLTINQTDGARDEDWLRARITGARVIALKLANTLTSVGSGE